MEKDEHGHIVSESFSRKKYKILGKFLKMATAKGKFFHGGFFYIETHAGTGKIFFKDSSRDESGSTLIALANEPQFHKYYFIEKEKESAEVLKNEVQPCKDKGVKIELIYGDCDKEIIGVVDNIPKGCYVFAFVDPEGYDFNWSTITKLMEIAKKGKIDLFVNLPTGGILRNRIRRDLSFEQWKELSEKITCMIGTDDWKKKRSTKQLAELFESQIKNVCPYFLYTLSEPVKNTIKATVYHLIFATNNEEVFEKYRNIVNRLEFAKTVPSLNRWAKKKRH
jgi:three-Cys-motif partner protein